MAIARSIRRLQYLRRRRRPLGFVMAALIAVSLAGVLLGQCLADQTSLLTVATADMSKHSPTMRESMPCVTCTAGSDSSSLAEGTLTLPANPKSWFVLALVVVSTLLSINLPKSVPIPPLPVLPKRPRTLKFYALRI
jgi:hypothetical protein